jgi:hypothetical protein
MKDGRERKWEGCIKHDNTNTWYGSLLIGLTNNYNLPNIFPAQFYTHTHTHTTASQVQIYICVCVCINTTLFCFLPDPSMTKGNIPGTAL